MPMPVHQPGFIVGSSAGSSGIGSWPSSVSRSLPPSPARTSCCSSSVEPYSDEPSHQCVTSLTVVIGPSAPAGRVGSSLIRGIRIGFSGQGSPGGSGMSTRREVSPSPWVNQSWIMNCSHDAARVFTLVAGRNGSRVSSRRLTSRGLGSISCVAGHRQHLVQRDVAAEPRAGPAHRRVVEVVVACRRRCG